MIKFVFQKKSFSEKHREKTKTARDGLSRGQVKSGPKQYIRSKCQYNKDREKKLEFKCFLGNWMECNTEKKEEIYRDRNSIKNGEEEGQ